ncbi:MAG: sigma-70 family RNA polymerase sigma factor [Alphaproteobacteria bacterium]|nr:sigma-70 family RNA polymerase sigma factor [Alphaproteobacteria bacterium]
MAAQQSSTTIEQALTTARPLAIAALLRYFNDLDKTEDAFQEACIRALKNWPQKGLPKNPTAWLIFVGRNIGIDEIRKTFRLSSIDEQDFADEEKPPKDYIYKDDLIRLLFFCCHPELSFEQQLALCLKIIVGMSVDEIAAAFLTKPATMAQRITRAKAKIATLTHQSPTQQERETRLTQVRTAIYLLFNEGYAANDGQNHIRQLECREAIRLARLLLQMMPSDAETMALLALCLLQNSRQNARLSETGEIILLEQQDRKLWDKGQIAEATAILQKAIRQGNTGQMQIEASIAAMHAEAATYAQTNWQEIKTLYIILANKFPSPVISLNLAAATFKNNQTDEALKTLAPLANKLNTYPYYHGLLAEIHIKMRQPKKAKTALEAALKLANSPAAAIHIREKIDQIKNNS